MPALNMDLLVSLMAAFEQGQEYQEGANPFEFDSILQRPEASEAVAAFAKAAAEDTPKRADVGEEDAEALVVAGIFQGLWLGFEYGRRSNGS